jgi:hypothetical protein
MQIADVSAKVALRRLKSVGGKFGVTLVGDLEAQLVREMGGCRHIVEEGCHDLGKRTAWSEALVGR